MTSPVSNKNRMYGQPYHPVPKADQKMTHSETASLDINIKKMEAILAGIEKVYADMRKRGIPATPIRNKVAKARRAIYELKQEAQKFV